MAQIDSTCLVLSGRTAALGGGGDGSCGGGGSDGGGDGPIKAVMQWLTALGSPEVAAAAEDTLLGADGACFGVSVTRPADGFASLLHRLLARLPRKHVLCAELASSAFWDVVASTFIASSRRARRPLLSPAGALSLVRAAGEALGKHAHTSASLLDTRVRRAALPGSRPTPVRCDARSRGVHFVLRGRRTGS